MKKRIEIVLGLVFLMVFSAMGQGNPGLTAEKRAQHLTDKMIKELRLNNYQARKLKDVNLDLVNKLISIETQYSDNPTLMEEKCEEVCRERDVAVGSFLSTDQYSQFYGLRSYINKLDREFATNAQKERLNVEKDPSGKGLDVEQTASQKKAQPKVKPVGKPSSRNDT
jgi:polyhydroxyalkanoate synthesis regulator phasin